MKTITCDRCKTTRTTEENKIGNGDELFIKNRHFFRNKYDICNTCCKKIKAFIAGGIEK